MNRLATRLTVIAAAGGLAVAALSGCSSSEKASSKSETTSSSAPSSSAAASGTACTKDGLSGAATVAAEALGNNNVYRIDDVVCADGWAATSGLLASKDNPDMGAPTSFLFQLQGQDWVAQAKTVVCGNPPTTPRPADSKVPDALYEVGCLAG